jgi:hypothetical protein
MWLSERHSKSNRNRRTKLRAEEVLSGDMITSWIREGLTKQQLENSRPVFIFLKNKKQKNKNKQPLLIYNWPMFQGLILTSLFTFFTVTMADTPETASCVSCGQMKPFDSTSIGLPPNFRLTDYTKLKG